MIKPEILAPAGSFESLIAAVRCGADAVYLGGNALNARRNAANFDDEEMARAIDYCHKRKVKVYVTVNTLVQDSEFGFVTEEIRKLCMLGADALIVQDIGLAYEIKKCCPDISLHASTQMSVQSAEGIKLLEDAGFSRAVLPRELSKSEIIAISSETDMELEYFVHGALCMCLSGQCLMSSVLGGRSGNRGLCAQPCRLPFGVNGGTGYNLSLKDLSLIDRISELVQAGVCSLKIEGRMKRPEYVAAAVTACKNAIDFTPDEGISKALGAVFSRSGFTSGYFDGKTGSSMFGIRTKNDVENSASALSVLSHLYDNENPLIPVDMNFSLTSGKSAELSVRSGVHTVTVRSDKPPVPAVSRAVTEADITDKISKCGGTQFYAEKTYVECDDGLYFSVSEINAMRRNALEKLEAVICPKKEIPFEKSAFEISKHSAGKKKLYVRFLDFSQIPESDFDCDRVIIPLDTPDVIAESFISRGIQVSAEIPVNVYSNAPKYAEQLRRLKLCGVRHASACNLDGIRIAENAGMDFSSFFGMNIFNSRSLEVIEALGAADALVSCELKCEDISALGGSIPRGCLIYGRIPMMVTRNCPASNKVSCSECGRKSFLSDRMGISFPVRCKNGCSFIFNSRPVSLLDKRNAIKNTDFDLLYFTVEEKEECSAVIDKYYGSEQISGEYTRGLYFRTVL